MKKNRITSAILAAIMCASILSACSQQSDISGTSSGDQTSPDVTETTAEETTVSYSSLISAKYADKNYGGAEVRVLGFGPGHHFYNYGTEGENELWFAEQSGIPMQDAIYLRNTKTEELLGVKLNVTFDSAPQNTIKTAVLADSDEYDIVLSRLDYQANNAQAGIYQNIMNLSAIDTKDAWWDADVVDNFTILKNKLYFISGDGNFYDDYAVQALFFNEKLFVEGNYGYDLYNLVRDGTWTFDVFYELVTNTTRDLNGDGKIDITNDMYGYTDNGGIIQHSLYMFGDRLSDKNENGEIVLQTQSEKLVDTIDKIYNFVQTKTVFVGDNNASQAAFEEDRVLFCTNMIGTLADLREMESDFGVLPMPKGDPSMTRYCAYVSNGWATAVAFPATASGEALTRAAHALDAMYAFSKDLVTPTLYNVMLESKLVRNTDSRDMLSYVFASKVFDWAGDLAWGQSLVSSVNSLASAASNSFTANMEKINKATTKQLEKMMDAYRELP